MILPLTSIAFFFTTPSPPTQLFTSVRVNVYYRLVSFPPFERQAWSSTERVVTPVVGQLVSTSVLILNAGLVIQQALLVAVLHVGPRLSTLRDSTGFESGLSGPGAGAATVPLLRSSPAESPARKRLNFMAS